MDKLKVAAIFGGRSAEHEISLLSAEAIMGAIDTERYEVVPIGITKEGDWIVGDDPLNALRALNKGKRIQGGVEMGQIPVTSLKKADIVFPILHGPYGEDGTIQGLLEMMDLPYVGAGVLGSALGMDKALQKAVLAQHELPVVDHIVFVRSRWERSRSQIIEAVEQRFPYPCFVKPACQGSSIGVSKVRSTAELVAGIEEAATHDRKIMVEQAVDAREIECSVLGNDQPMASPLGEIIPANEFYDYEAKYSSSETRLVIPADLPAPVTSEMRRLAVAAFQAIDAAGMARVDMFLERGSGKIYINELNTIPGFTQVSMYPKLWEVAGIGFPDLVGHLLRLGLERYEERKQCGVASEPSVLKV